VNYNDRRPDAEVVEGLKRADFATFLKDLLTIRNAWIAKRGAELSRRTQRRKNRAKR
jgi:hypothetical protein